MRGARRLHLLWGWLQIGEVCKVDRIESDERFRWARYHDHFLGGYDETNTVHVASENLDLGDGLSAPGFGFFSGSMTGSYLRSLARECPNGSCRGGSIPMGTRRP